MYEGHLQKVIGNKNMLRDNTTFCYAVQNRQRETGQENINI